MPETLSWKIGLVMKVTVLPYLRATFLVTYLYQYTLSAILVSVSKRMSISVWPPVSFFFFNDTATTEIYTLSLHDALPINLAPRSRRPHLPPPGDRTARRCGPARRSQEHTAELQSRRDLVCRLLLAKKKTDDEP